jgi:hypothetical protein
VSRALTFWTDANIKLIKENFVAAAVPTWTCRAKSPEGEFLRGAGIDKQWVTSSGYMICVSPSGKMLGYSPSTKVLEAFRKLPESERVAGAIKVPDLKPEERLIPSPPERGLVLKVHARFLSRDENGGLRYARTEDFPLMTTKSESRNPWKLFLEPNTEYMWITEEEGKSLLPAKAQNGMTFEFNPRLIDRLVRFHLTPRRAMTSEGGILRKNDVKMAKASLVVEEVTPDRIRMRLDGQIHTGAEFDRDKATTPNGPLGFGFQSSLHGIIEYDRTRQRFTRFDVVAPGEVWGRWGDANGKSLFAERPESTPFGFAFELSDGKSPTERIPPGGNPAYIGPKSGYFEAAR